MNLAMTAEIRAGRPVFPMLEVAWVSRGYTIETARYARGGANMADGVPARGLVPRAGFGAATFGPGMMARGNTLVAARTTVKLNDADGSLRAMLATYDPRDSVATVRWVSPCLASTDFEPVFYGRVFDWTIQEGVVELQLKTHDAALQAPGPKPIFSRAEWPRASEVTIFGTVMPLVTGIHDSYKVTGRGMVPAVNIRWDEDAGSFWWCGSIGALATIPRIYYDGSPKQSGFTVVRGTYGGVYQTIISVDAANVPVDGEGKPDPGVVVSFDCSGPDASGGITSATLTNPLAELRAFLNNYVLRDNRSAFWEGDHVTIDTAAWDVAEVYFDLYGYEGAFRIGGGESQPAAKVIEAFLKSHPWVKMWWTPSGKLSITILAHEDRSVSDTDWTNIETKVASKEFKYIPGDRRDVYSGVVNPYLYSHAEQKYLGSYEVHDLTVKPANVTEVEDEFSQGRYSLD